MCDASSFLVVSCNLHLTSEGLQVVWGCDLQACLGGQRQLPLTQSCNVHAALRQSCALRTTTHHTAYVVALNLHHGPHHPSSTGASGLHGVRACARVNPEDDICT
jgi:hypothetical protein